MPTARDLMTPVVTTVQASSTLHELALLFQRQQISGAPVVDHDGGLVGVVSRSDLAGLEALPPPASIPIPILNRIRDVEIYDIAQCGVMFQLPRALETGSTWRLLLLHGDAHEHANHTCELSDSF